MAHKLRQFSDWAQCPGWVKNGSARVRAARPFYPQVQTSSACPGMCVWCTKGDTGFKRSVYQKKRALIVKNSCAASR